MFEIGDEIGVVKIPTYNYLHPETEVGDVIQILGSDLIYSEDWDKRRIGHNGYGNNPKKGHGHWFVGIKVLDEMQRREKCFDIPQEDCLLSDFM